MKQQKTLMKPYNAYNERWSWKLQKKKYFDQKRRKLRDRGQMQRMKMILQVSNNEKIDMAKQNEVQEMKIWMLQAFGSA